jgi:thiosulfate/3-mercaptopyruvate sulfurtransferase
MEEAMADYAHPDVLVTTDWVQEHQDDPNVRLVEVNEDVLLYETGHIPGAVKIDWLIDLWDDTIREFVQPEELAQLLERLASRTIRPWSYTATKTIGGASYAFWFFKYNGHENLKLMNGGRAKWVAENRPLTTDATEIQPAPTPPVSATRSCARSEKMCWGTSRRWEAGTGALVDVRSPGEFRGDVTHMPDYPQEGVLRGGHIPGAQSIPWAQAANADGTFKSADELKALYEPKGVTGDKEVIAYCRIAERSSHSWFVLKYLLGYENVKNYDGSWTEWGNAVGVPIEKGDAK